MGPIYPYYDYDVLRKDTTDCMSEEIRSVHQQCVLC